jgi:uncharacterized protein involved in response to NO
MTRKYNDSEVGPKHTAFQQGFIWVALAAALGVGFPIGAHLTSVLGFGFPVSKGFASFVQTHGHVQLVGWAGLMIIGISLHFIPRLAGIPLAHPQWLRPMVWLLASGLVLRSIGQPVLPYLTERPTFSPVVWLLALSGGLECAGIVLYVWLLIRTFGSVRDVDQRPALLAVRPYFGMMVAGWLVYSGTNVALLIDMARHAGVVVHPAWNQVAIQGFLGLTLLPVAFAFSVRMLPLYLRLAVPDWPVRGFAHVYLAAVALHILPTLPPLLGRTPHVATDLSSLGLVLKGGSVLWFVWQVDVLTRRRAPWTVHRQLHPGPERRPTRPGLPDYGEFGRFEWLVYAAYIWLALAAGGELVAGGLALARQPVFISSMAIRHMYLLGFITLLILGMAVRMLPGFLQQRRVAHPALVAATFWLGNTAVVSRILPFVVPPVILQHAPGIAFIAQVAFGTSGLLGFAAVGCLAWNLWHTARER